MTCTKCQTHTPLPRLNCSCCGQILRYAKLRLVLPNGIEQHIPLNGAECSIGRDACNAVVLQDDLASRTHARLSLHEGAYRAEDLNSKNGTYLNGERITARPLHPLDCLQIGGTRIYFILHEAARQQDLTHALAKHQTTTRFRLAPEEVFAPVWRCFLKGVCQFTQAERATLWLQDTSGDLIPRLHLDEPTAGLQLRPQLRAKEMQHDLARKIFQSGSTIIRRQPDATETFTEGLTAEAEIVYELLGIPLRHTPSPAPRDSCSAPPFGVLVCERNSSPQKLPNEDKARLQDFITRAEGLLHTMQTVLTLLQSNDTHSSTEQTAVACSIQALLEPLTIPQVRDTDLAAWHHPAGKVSGDYVDFIPLSPHEILIAVGDVAGKDLTAALAIFALQKALHLLASYETCLENIIAALNQIAHAVGHASNFTTLFLGVLQVERKTLHYINAGHTPGLYIRTTEATPTVELLHSHAAALGVLENLTAAPRTLLLYAGAALLLFTDGITEAVDEHDTQYGLARLSECVAAALLASPPNNAARVLETLRADLTLHSADFHGKVKRHDDQAAVLLRLR